MLLNCSPGSESDVISEISSLSGVVEVNGVLGKYDIFVKIFADNPDGMEMTVSQIRKIKAISSHTLPVIYGQGGTIDNEIDES
ncbi:MAG: Lrp/AsnC ligand binding domain-containing protein [Nitrosopumilus sp.]|uniref:Lrp/AsnC ligand binding domain-containing protein n=1 Tax=Nitrosopumilus sp. TaxID=2024843 RepID=UPI00292F1D84|nr:Lrp/AsnC ligand binding domain-containing protein [Nitrosopumilus sp.]